MSAIANPTTPHAAGHDGHDDHHHVPFLAHHFESHEQQFDACKFGVWLFLVTEVLFFSGLFCFYTIYRVNHPEVFVWSHQFLDKNMGALNTIVLLFSSLTMALAVRCAQLGRRNGLIINLVLTLACAGAFMVVKYFEYSHKFEYGTLWRGQYALTAHGEEHLHHLNAHGGHATQAPTVTWNGSSEPVIADPNMWARKAVEDSGPGGAPTDAGTFFSIYFCLTGLHGIHIVGGMIALTWLLFRAIRGDFTSQYFGPVDFVGLYWHLVDLIWIYLFPLLYLIH